MPRYKFKSKEEMDRDQPLFFHPENMSHLYGQFLSKKCSRQLYDTGVTHIHSQLAFSGSWYVTQYMVTEVEDD
jgi:hypothetical protein